MVAVRVSCEQHAILTQESDGAAFLQGYRLKEPLEVLERNGAEHHSREVAIGPIQSPGEIGCPFAGEPVSSRLANESLEFRVCRERSEIIPIADVDVWDRPVSR